MNNPSIHQPNLDVIALETKLQSDYERSQTKPSDRQSLPSSGDKVYLYGDRTYTGILIHPIERTSPAKWTVQLDRGGYEAVNLNHISLVKPNSGNLDEPELVIPFGDEDDTDNIAVEKLRQEIIALKTENVRLKQENEMVRKDLDIARQVIRRAKDISPLMRISLKRVLRLAHDACMDVQKTVGGWILRMGKFARKFRRLADIWDILSQDGWYLSEIFPEDKLVALDLILPPRPRKPRQIPEKRTFPMMRPEDIMRNRTMLLVKSG